MNHNGKIIILIIISEICKAPSLWLRALNKHNITHVMYIEFVFVGVCGGVCVCVSNLNSSGRRHSGSLFTNEEQKKPCWLLSSKKQNKTTTN